MSPAFVKIIIAALAAGVTALPQSMNTTSTTSGAAPTATDGNAALIEQLKDAPKAIDRFKKLLTNNGETILSEDELRNTVVFDFNGAQPAAGAKDTGGALKSAQIDTFPILTDLGISTTMGFLSACGLNTPHIHPRASEFLTVVEGELDFGFIVENNLVKSGSTEARGHLSKFNGAVFPMGSIHYQVNPTCQPAVFVASLNSEDPGTSQIAQNFFGLDPDVVNATLGFPKQLDGKDIESFKNQIPVNVALGIEQCLERCSIKKS
ncbi:uncharacterized protein K452DRAFT_240196 [Aplosporella prunicola CBS 121167]